MNRDRLDARLEQVFGASAAECRVVVRQAGDLHDSGRYAAIYGAELTVADVIENLREAPDDLGVVERWNWWIGALHLAHDGFDSFLVRRYRGD